jgi:hypothetical protein
MTMRSRRRACQCSHGQFSDLRQIRDKLKSSGKPLTEWADKALCEVGGAGVETR